MGAALLARAEAIKRVGLLDERFFMYVEEQEWCFRLKTAGWPVWFYPGALVVHLVRGSSPEGRGRAIVWIFQGLVYFYRKHFAGWKLNVLKFLLRAKASLAFGVGFVRFDENLKKTYREAFKAIEKVE
jgi:GT2 family glycosyltransferase